MLNRRLFVALTLGLFLLAVGTGYRAAEEKKADQKGGSVVGVVTAKGNNSIEVKADGEDKARTYVPNWVGGAPAQGGGPDKTMLATIAKTPIGARVKLDWKFEERARVVKLEVLQSPKEKDKK